MTTWGTILEYFLLVFFTAILAVGLCTHQRRREAAKYHALEGALRAEIQALTALINAAPESMFLMDTRGVILCANEITAQRFGLPLAKLRGSNVYTLLPPHWTTARRAQLELIKQTGEPLEFDEARSHWIVRRLFYPIRNAQGVVVQIAVFSKDVTEQRRAAAVMAARLRLMDFAATHSLEELLQATLDEAEALTHSSVGFYHFLEPDQQTLLLQAWSTRTKREFCRVKGYRVHHPLTAAGVWADCIRERRPVIHNDYAALTNRRGVPPGHVHLLRELVVPVFREDRIVAILGVGNKAQPYHEQDVDNVAALADLAWDIVERKRVEAALLESEARYRRIVETTNEGIWTVDTENRVSFVNPQMATLLGYRLQDMQGQPVTTFLFETDWLDYRERVRSQRQGRSGRHQRRLRRRDGSGVWTLASTVPIFDANGQFQGALTMFTDITLLKEQQRQLEQMAHYDPLTGLPNRVLLADRLQLALAQARRRAQRVAVCYLDLDGFKPINDTLGHEAGDRLLIEFAQRIAHSLREGDTVARLGGDEFVLLLVDQEHIADYERTLDRLLAVIAEPYDLGYEAPLYLSASIGVALFPDDAIEPEELLRQADQAMYQVKRGGRCGYRRFNVCPTSTLSILDPP